MYLPYVNRIGSLTIDFDPVWRKRVRSADRIEVLLRTGLNTCTFGEHSVPSYLFHAVVLSVVRFTATVLCWVRCNTVSNGKPPVKKINVMMKIVASGCNQ